MFEPTQLYPQADFADDSGALCGHHPGLLHHPFHPRRAALRLILGEKATPEAIAALTEKLGLTEPLISQYFLFLRQIFTLDFGNSFTYQMPVAKLLASRFPVTLALTLMSTALSLLISLPLGYFAGVHKDKLGDQAVRTASLVAISMPSFWVGLLLMIVFALKLRWFPAGGWADTLGGQFRCLILPAITQSLMTTALLLRNTRNCVVDITRMDYVDFARSKGIPDSEVRTRHVMRNAMVSTVTLLSMRMAATLGAPSSLRRCSPSLAWANWLATPSLAGTTPWYSSSC